MKVFCAPDLEQYRDLALAIVDRRFNDQSGREPSQVAMDAMKVAEARYFQETGQSWLIEDEAAVRGIKPEGLADQIIALHQTAMKRELRRVRLKEEIRGLKTHADIAAVLSREAIPFTVPQGATVLGK